MDRPKFVTAALICLAVAGCSDATGPARYAVPVVEPAETVRVRYRAIEVREVSLPEYAALSEMAIQAPDGGIATRKSLLWADDPVRSVTLELSRNLSQVTGVTVASEPWPFDGFPDARVEVRIEEMIADSENQFRLSGQFFVGPVEGLGRMRSQIFSLTVPLTEGTDPFAMAKARGKIVSELAVLIAKDGLR